jgi:predicted RecB family nuclease
VQDPWNTFITDLATARQGELVYGREVLIHGAIGAFDLSGAIDFVVLLWEGLLPILRLVETKAARRDRTYQLIQVAIYGLLVGAALTALPLVVGGARLAPVAV